MDVERTVMAAPAPIVPLAAQKIRYAQDSYPAPDVPLIFWMRYDRREAAGKRTASKL